MRFERLEHGYLDTETGLIWSVGNDQEYTWEEAVAYCKNLKHQWYSDWRLPTDKEIESVVDRNLSCPATLLVNMEQGGYWTSTEYNNQRAWSMDFNMGIPDYNLKEDRFLVRAVRDSEEVPEALNFRGSDTTPKHKEVKPQYSLLDMDTIEELIKVYQYGIQKYYKNSWRKGLEWSELYDAAMRHINAFWRNEEDDPESGLKHLAHAAWNCLTLLYYNQNNKGTDDRIKEK